MRAAMTATQMTSTTKQTGRVKRRERGLSSRRDIVRYLSAARRSTMNLLPVAPTLRVEASPDQFE